MKNEKIININRMLNSIGKKCYLKYFYEFRDTNLSNKNLVVLISEAENYKYNATKTRVNTARRILKMDLEKNALKIIINSNKLNIKLREKAKRIFENVYTRHVDGL